MKQYNYVFIIIIIIIIQFPYRSRCLQTTAIVINLTVNCCDEIFSQVWLHATAELGGYFFHIVFQRLDAVLGRFIEERKKCFEKKKAMEPVFFPPAGINPSPCDALNLIKNNPPMARV